MMLGEAGVPLFELGELLQRRQLAVQQQVRDLHERAVFGQLLDGVAAVGQDALVAVDVADGRGLVSRAYAADGVGVARVVVAQRLAIDAFDLAEVAALDVVLADGDLVRLAGPVVRDRQRLGGALRVSCTERAADRCDSFHRL